MKDETFYFVAKTTIDAKKALTVIDLAYCANHEREDWHTVDDQDFYILSVAIEHARKLAKYNNIDYKPFESRYDSSLNEKNTDILQYPENYEL